VAQDGRASRRRSATPGRDDDRSGMFMTRVGCIALSAGGTSAMCSPRPTRTAMHERRRAEVRADKQA
jgi:hypothetical protein